MAFNIHHISVALRRQSLNATVVLLALLLGACHSSVRESHFFATYPDGDRTKPPVNYFRVTVEGDSRFSNARYLAGFYDERAVDLFFSELKAGDQNLLKDGLKNPGTSEVLKPLDPDENGAFVMILSTNADSIAATIGAFADSEVVGNAITQLTNRSHLAEAARADAGAGPKKTNASASTDELQSRLNAAGNASSASATRDAYLQAVNLIARELDRPQGFTSLNDALIWLQSKGTP